MSSVKFRNFDLFRRVPVDLTEPTAPGAIISVACMVLMTLLFVGEFVSYISPSTRSDMFVAQDSASNARLKVTVDMSFHRLPCFALGFDVLDALGRHEMGVSNTLKKTRLSPADGTTEIGEWVEGRHDANREYPGMKNEGCRVRGFVMVNKVPGNFHVSSHGLENLVMQYLGGTIDVQHTIHELFFGELALHSGRHDYEGEVHPLNGHAQRHNGAFHYEYHLDIVPTIYTRAGLLASTSTERSYQMAVSQHFQEAPQGHMPAAFFRYQLSPITVNFSKERTSFLHFLTYVCAIVGGIYSVAGVLNRMVNKAVVGFQKGVLGKDS